MRELGLEKGVDTLGRWMAHYVAELIEHAKKAKTPAERAVSKNKAVETIIQIWEHRASSDRINPLADLTPILKVLRTLTDKISPWANTTTDGRSTAGRRIYDLLRGLTICLSFLELQEVKAARQALTRAQRTAKHQSKEEQELLVHLALWLDTFPPLKETPLKTGRRSTKVGNQKASPPDLSSIAISIVDEIETALADLKKELAAP